VSALDDRLTAFAVAIKGKFDALNGMFVTPAHYGGSVQAAINSGAPAVLIPPGDTVVSSIVMPKGKTNFTLFGFGRASRLIVTGGPSAAIGWDQTANVYDEQKVCNLTLVGTNGSQHLIDLTGAGGVLVEDVFVTDVPAGKYAVYANGAASNYIHDQTIRGLDVYSNTAGQGAVGFGPYSADASLQGFEVNGNFQLQYCIRAETGALTTSVAGGHPYNAANNIVKMDGGNNDWRFTDVTFDNAHQDLFRCTGLSALNISNCYFEAIQSGYSGLYADGSGEGISIRNSNFGGGFGAASCVRTGASMNGVQVQGGTIDAANHFTKLWDFNGLRSDASGVNGDVPGGFNWPLVATGLAAQASAVEWLGTRNSATKAAAVYSVPIDCRVTAVYFALSATPPGTDTFTFQVYGGTNGTTALGSPLTLSTGQLSGTITLNQSLNAHDQFVIQSTYSGALANAGIVRWSAWFKG
jgi:hypothetical protein